VRVRNRGYCRVNNRRLPQRNFAFDRFTNTPLIGRNSPPRLPVPLRQNIQDEAAGIKLASEFLSLV